MNAPLLTGGQAIVRSLVTQGVDTVFTVPGLQLDFLCEALVDEQASIRTLHTRHEQGAAYMAFGYAQASGKVGVYAVVPGPGMLNSCAALSTAYACNAQVFCFAGQIPSALIGRNIGALHEIPDQLGVLRGLTKWAARADHAGEVPGLVAEAFRQLFSGRPRPVALEMAMDALGRAAPADLAARVVPSPAPAPDPDLVERAAAILGAASAPILVVGGGAVAAGAEVAELARMLDAAVVASPAGRGVLSDDSDHVLPTPAAHEYWATADAALGVGTRLAPMVLGWGIDDEIPVVRIDIDPDQIARTHTPAVGLVTDAAAGLRALIERLPAHITPRALRGDHRRALKAKWRAQLATALPQMAYVAAIEAALPEDGFFVEDLTQVAYAARLGLCVRQPRRFVTTGYQGTLGFGFATALGVKVGRPDCPVVSVSGDGGFLFTSSEMATAIRHRIDVVAIVFNDNSFSNVRQLQEQALGGKTLGCDLANPDFVRMAESFGWAAQRAAGPAALTAALERALAAGGPTLIEVPVPRFPDSMPYFLRLPRNRKG